MKDYPGSSGGSAWAPSSGYNEFGFKEGIFVECEAPEGHFIGANVAIICQIQFCFFVFLEHLSND